MEQKPEWFREGVKIGSVYGAFPPALWNGGRGCFGTCDEKTMKAVLETYNSKGIPCRYTFTNPLIKEEHLGNPFCNLMLRLGDNGLNEVIVNSPLLEDYIRKNYPSYKITSSTCKQIRGEEALVAELEKDYNLVVLDYNWNNDFEFLERLPHKEKCELLVNACCTPNCKRRGEHYSFLGKQQIQRSTINSFQGMGGMQLNVQQEKPFVCEAIQMNFLETVKFSTHVTPDTLYNKYVPLGYEQFKIEGRTIHPLNVIESYVYYMVKPEHKDMVRLKLGLSVFTPRG